MPALPIHRAQKRGYAEYPGTRIPLAPATLPVLSLWPSFFSLPLAECLRRGVRSNFPRQLKSASARKRARRAAMLASEAAFEPPPSEVLAHANIPTWKRYRSTTSSSFGALRQALHKMPDGCDAIAHHCTPSSKKRTLTSLLLRRHLDCALSP